MVYRMDIFGRWWPYPIAELCPTCGQPDSCGDCNHNRLSDQDVGRILNADEVIPMDPTDENDELSALEDARYGGRATMYGAGE